MKNRKALLIIDMQKGSFTTKTPRFDTEGVVDRMNELKVKYGERFSPASSLVKMASTNSKFHKE